MLNKCHYQIYICKIALFSSIHHGNKQWKKTVSASSLPRCVVKVAIEGAPEQKTKYVKTCDRLGPFLGFNF